MVRYMTNPLTRMNVKQQIILLFVVMVSPILLLQWYGNTKAEQILKNHVTDAYAELNKQNIALLGRDIDTVTKITTTIVQNPLTQQLIPNAKDTVFERVQEYAKLDKLIAGYSIGVNGGEAVYYSLYVYDPNNYYSFAPKIPMTQTGVYFFQDQDKPEWFDEAVAKKGDGYMKLIRTNIGFSTQTTLAYIRSVSNISDYGVIGVLVATKMDKKIEESLRSVSLPDGQIYFTDGRNRVLTATTPSMIGSTLRLPPEAATKKADPDGMINIITPEFIYVINDNHLLQQKLVYKIPVQSLLLQQNELKRVIQLISVVYIVLGIIIMLYFWQSLMNPLTRLAHFVRSFEPGRRVPETPGKGRKDEVGQLIAALYDMARRLNVLIHYKYQSEIKEKESQLQLLYQQINPHLLYNTLESIYWKSSLEGNSESAEMIKELSKLMKISLSRGRELIALEEEMEHAKAYVSLQSKRYEYTFSVAWNVPEELRNNLIPKITLQPLIENAIIHGVRHMGEDGEILVSANLLDGDKVMIRVEDNGYKKVDFDAIHRLLNEEKGNPAIGYGIRNLHQRIRLHFGKSYGIRYEKREGHGTTAIIVLPRMVEQELPGTESLTP
ncbi:cache domain-containing sensor histidine kinase [Paenibacillus sacheonensis]|uniref:Sensor histidine kinase n=1 Tax=Paenibacillus sacheonensis TaxID=742054 RepID=A0A7X4YLS8_9BACL|nr:histidine kinase [Paenibacillus sacheonensis]MBM7565966.1 two-component system sensor histidine kinase YesM [Paenibacillus sacheonensis]NBC68720.1 sensor histidine kinase [Paenibacillus sacheonensis]